MNREKLKEIYKKYNLEPDDIFILKLGGREVPIIKRVGIEKIQNLLNIEVKFDLKEISEDFKSCVILATGVILQTDSKTGQKRPSSGCQSFGECSPENNKNKFPICMAEKRALARVVIKMCNLAELGVYSEDESHDFNTK